MNTAIELYDERYFVTANVSTVVKSFFSATQRVGMLSVNYSLYTVISMKAALNIFGNEYCEIYVSNDKDTIETRVFTISLSSIIVGQSEKNWFL